MLVLVMISVTILFNLTESRVTWEMDLWECL